MEPHPNLFHALGDWWDYRQTERLSHATADVGQPGPSPSRWLPTRGNVLFTLLLVGLLILAQTVGALPSARQQGMAPAAPSTGTIAYQGRLADADGNPLTNSVPMIFRLYDASAGGAPLWEEQWTGSSSVQVSDGLFNVMLGSLAPIPAALITSNASLFLGITVGTDDEMAPRVQLGSVPFAVQALTVPDGSVTTGKLADGAVTQTKLGADVSLTPPDGSITTAKIADGAITSEKLSRRMTKVLPTGVVSLTNANTSYDVLSATVTLAHETLVTIHASAGLQSNTDTLLYALIEVDGTSLITSHNWQKGGVGEHHMLSTSVMLGEGQHVVKLRAGSWANNSIANDDNRTQMVIIEG